MASRNEGAAGSSQDRENQKLNQIIQVSKTHIMKSLYKLVLMWDSSISIAKRP